MSKWHSLTVSRHSLELNYSHCVRRQFYIAKCMACTMSVGGFLIEMYKRSIFKYCMHGKTECQLEMQTSRKPELYETGDVQSLFLYFPRNFSLSWDCGSDAEFVRIDLLVKRPYYAGGLLFPYSSMSYRLAYRPRADR